MPGLEIRAAVREGPMCRIEAVARPRPRAAIGIELWLPPAGRWSGRYYQMGNGGFAGRIDRPTLAAAAARGDAAAATDTGHVGDGFDARWAAGRPDLVEDYAYRSIKVTSDAARRLVAAYYGRAPRHRYFMGCSFGGRQALVAAARWPGDWDGVIAGAPATQWTARLSSFAAIQHALRSVPGAWIAPERVPPLIGAARACAGSPGAACSFRALAKGCAAGDRRLCLSAAQHSALRTIEAAGYPLATADPAEWRRWIVNPDTTAPSQLIFAVQAHRYLFGAAPNWTVARYDPVKDAAPERIGAIFEIGSLRPFAAKGGRILSYFGTADAVLPPSRAVTDVVQLAGSGSTAALARAYRLFMVPGMAHCQGGAAPHALGQSIAAPSALDDPRHDVRRALEAWVEKGNAPQQLVAATLLAERPRRNIVLTPVRLE